MSEGVRRAKRRITKAWRDDLHHFEQEADSQFFALEDEGGRVRAKAILDRKGGGGDLVREAFGEDPDRYY